MFTMYENDITYISSTTVLRGMTNPVARRDNHVKLCQIYIAIRMSIQTSR
jgi:hypothetical protein